MVVKLVNISDTHNLLSQIKVPVGDLLIHAGDWTLLGQQSEMKKFGTQIRKIRCKNKLLIPGNHDLTTEVGSEFYHKDWLNWVNPDDNIHITINQEFSISGINFYCTSLINPIHNYYRRWAYETVESKQRDIYDAYIPSKQIDILLSHTPPYGIMDENGYGSKALYDLVQRLKPKIHIFGHAHDGYGKKQIGDTLFINASICNREYQPVHKPIVIEY